MAPRPVMGAPYVSDGHCSASTAAAGTARGRHVPHPRHVFSPLCICQSRVGWQSDPESGSEDRLLAETCQLCKRGLLPCVCLGDVTCRMDTVGTPS